VFVVGQNNFKCEKLNGHGLLLYTLPAYQDEAFLNQLLNSFVLSQTAFICRLYKEFCTKYL
jgi:hypothetical protein